MIHLLWSHEPGRVICLPKAVCYLVPSSQWHIKIARRAYGNYEAKIYKENVCAESRTNSVIEKDERHVGDRSGWGVTWLVYLPHAWRSPRQISLWKPRYGLSFCWVMGKVVGKFWDSVEQEVEVPLLSSQRTVIHCVARWKNVGNRERLAERNEMGVLIMFQSRASKSSHREANAKEPMPGNLGRKIRGLPRHSPL